MQRDLGDPQNPKYANISVISSLLKKLQKKSNISDNICDIECLSVKLIFKESGVLSSCTQSFKRLYTFSNVLQLIQPSIDF